MAPPEETPEAEPSPTTNPSSSSSTMPITSFTLPPPGTALTLPPPGAPLSTSLQSRIHSLHPSLPLSHLYNQLSTLSSTLSETLSLTTSFPSLSTHLQTATLTTASLVQKTRSCLSKFRTAARYNLEDISQVERLVSTQRTTAAEKVLLTRRKHNQALSKASHSLALLFETSAETLSRTLHHAISTQAGQKTRVESLQSSTADSYMQLVRAKDSHSAADTRLCEADSLYKQAEVAQQAAHRRSTILHAAHLSAVVGTYMVTKSPTLALSVTGAAALVTNSDGDIMRAREERAVHLVQRNEARDERAVASAQIAELSQQLRCTRREENLSGVVLSNVERCVETLRKLAGVMIRVEEFWRDVSQDVDGAEGEFWMAVGVVCDGALRGVEEVSEGRDVGRVGASGRRFLE